MSPTKNEVALKQNLDCFLEITRNLGKNKIDFGFLLEITRNLGKNKLVFVFLEITRNLWKNEFEFEQTPIFLEIT